MGIEDVETEMKEIFVSPSVGRIGDVEKELGSRVIGNSAKNQQKFVEGKVVDPESEFKEVLQFYGNHEKDLRK